jgi:hypothetical protein
VLAHVAQIEVLKAPVTAQVKKDQNGHNFAIGEFRRPPAFDFAGLQGMFGDFFFKFDTKVINFTKNFCKFILMVHGG